MCIGATFSILAMMVSATLPSQRLFALRVFVCRYEFMKHVLLDSTHHRHCVMNEFFHYDEYANDHVCQCLFWIMTERKSST